MNEYTARNYLQKILKIISILFLRRYKPAVIGITGSVGKTSAKEAIYTVLNKKYQVRRSVGSYNNEIGVPLTILGEKSAGKMLIGWAFIFFRSFLKLLYCRYPKILILEMGIDKPGDMDYLLGIVRPDVGIITAISEIPVHLENFSSVKELAKEKFKLIEALNDNDHAVVNIDNHIIKKFQPETSAKLLTIGFEEEADIKASNVVLNTRNIIKQIDAGGMSFKLNFQRNTLPVRLPNMLGKHQIYAALSAVACGIIFDLNLVEISEALKELKPPKGRLNLIKGIKDTTIIDDTYNASPDSTKAALTILGKLTTNGRKIAVLGDMKELGEKSEKGHREVGRISAEVVDILIVVGESSVYIADEALISGLSEGQIYSFKNSEDAGIKIQNEILQKNDLLLIKGSQAMRMEIIVKELMSNPLRASDLLVRQGKDWLKR